MALRGTFAETDPEDVLQILAIGGRTGMLTVRDHGQSTRIVFQNGRIIDAFDGLQRGEDAVFSLLVSRAGSFSFTQEDVPPDTTIDRTVPAILLSATRRLDDLRRAREVLKGPTSRPYRTEAIPDAALSAEAGELLQMVDGQRTLGEIVAASDQSLEIAYRHLTLLVELGLVAIAVASDDDRPLTSRGLDSDSMEIFASAGGPVRYAEPTPVDFREIATFLRQAVDPS